MTYERASFFGASALLFTISTALTIHWCASMSMMCGMPWMRMPGQTWPGIAASFLGMWLVMMVAMMLPSLVPMLWRYRQAAGEAGSLTALVATGYFFVWMLFGVAAFALGVTVLARATPLAAGTIVTLAGALQFTDRKMRYLTCCREAAVDPDALAATARSAWRHGLRLGVHCSFSCAGLTAILLVIGVMDLRAMAAVTAAITLERLAPAGERAARAIGVVVVAAGLFLIVRTIAP
jgi:predicted metal-binding membrane protein